MGLGRRTFAAGEVLTASNVMNYLMDQSVMNFPGTAARGSAIGTAVQEGMISFLNDSNMVEAYDGSAWKALAFTGGGILQVQSANLTTVATIATSTLTDTGLTVSITPKYASSKILIIVSAYTGFTNGANDSYRFNLVRNSTTIAQSTGGSLNATMAFFPSNANAGTPLAVNFLDSPNTTSATTYKIQYARDGATGTVSIGSYAVNTANRSISTITAIEVAG
jgi:hypothetical protein